MAGMYVKHKRVVYNNTRGLYKQNPSCDPKMTVVLKILDHSEV